MGVPEGSENLEKMRGSDGYRKTKIMITEAGR